MLAVMARRPSLRLVHCWHDLLPSRVLPNIKKFFYYYLFNKQATGVDGGASNAYKLAPGLFFGFGSQQPDAGHGHSCA